MVLTEKDTDRFWSKVNKVGPDECWDWTAACCSGGYGVIGICHFRKVYSYRSHRLAWESTYGSITKGLCVCHKCDNRKCCNPKHLFLGTNQENVTDRNAKGRVAHREKHCRAKLTERDVIDIRNQMKNGMSQTNVAKRYGISQRTCSDIKSSKTWKRLLSQEGAPS